MSTADLAVQVFRELESEDFRVLHIIEAGMAKHESVPTEQIRAFAKSLGVGKEADVYDALSPDGKRIAIKFHRLGRISFRQTRRKRGYAREHSSWLFQSHIAADREFQAMKLVYEN